MSAPSFLRFVIMHIYGVILLFNYERFDSLRRSKGITQKFIAQSLGRSATLCQDWKQHKSQPNAAQLSVLASILDTTPQYLCDESDEISPLSSDDELEQLLTALRDREDMRLLFKLAKDATPDDVRQAVKIIEALRASE